MKICIILNGEIENYETTKSIINNENYDYIICADGGANHSYKMDIIPNYILGDLDSVHSDVVDYYKSNNVAFKQFPAKKNETDAELCIYLATTLKANQIDFIGGLGGRVDHMIANINLLYYVKDQNIIPRILTDKEEIYIAIDEEISLRGQVGDTISVIPVKGDAYGVTLKNLEYPLENYHMKYSVPIGISNIMLEQECKVKVDSGTLLIIRNI